MALDPLQSYHDRALEMVRRYHPNSLIGIAVSTLHRVHAEGVEVMRQYQPWNVLLVLKWVLQEADANCHLRPVATENDFIDLLNLLHQAEGEGKMPDDFEHAYLFMRQLASQQFWLQRGVDGDALARQFLLFSALPPSHPLHRMFFQVTQVAPAEFIEIAFVVLGRIGRTPTPVELERGYFEELAKRFSPGAVAGFLKHLSPTGQELHNKFKQSASAGTSLHDQRILPTPLLQTPLILDDRGHHLVIFPTLVMRALESVIYRTLREFDSQEFGKEFGPPFEAYIGNCLQSAGIDFLDEQALQELLEGEGKCIDFLVREADCSIYIDAKGIEASRLVRIPQTGEMLSQSLKNSAVKAIWQGMETINRVSKLPPDSPIADRGEEIHNSCHS